MRRIRTHLSYANMMSTLAVLLILSGGSAYAATHLPKNSVASKQVRNGSLLAKDFKPGQLPAGPQGASGISGYEVVTSAEVNNQSMGAVGFFVECPAGTMPLGGGAVGSGTLQQNLQSSYPDGNRWDVVMNNPSPQNYTVKVYAVCATLTP